MTIQPVEITEVNSALATLPAGCRWRSYPVDNNGVIEYHIMPVLDLMEHVFDACGCEPVAHADEDGDVIFAHTAWDGRDYLDQVQSDEEREARRQQWHDYLDSVGVLPQFWEDVTDMESLELSRKLSAIVTGEAEAPAVVRKRDLRWTLAMASTILSSPVSVRGKVTDMFALTRLYVANGDRDAF